MNSRGPALASFAQNFPRACVLPPGLYKEEAADPELQHHGPFDVVMLGSPCQPFCHAGCHEHRDARIQITSNGLRIAVRRQPSWIILENVPEIVRHNNGQTWDLCLQRLPPDRPCGPLPHAAGHPGCVPLGTSAQTLDLPRCPVPGRWAMICSRKPAR